MRDKIKRKFFRGMGGDAPPICARMCIVYSGSTGMLFDSAQA